MSRTEETVSPPWGSLPVERYLLVSSEVSRPGHLRKYNLY